MSIDIRCCDNLDLMKSIESNTIDLIYCDILYGTGRNFGDYKDLKPIRSEIESHYLPRLIEMKRVLKQNGSIYLQMDTRINHWMRILMDKVFGYDNFRNEISWGYRTGGGTKKRWMPKSDRILFYAFDGYTFNPQNQIIRQHRYYGHKSIKEYKDEKGWYRLGTCRDFIDDIQPDVGQSDGVNKKNVNRVNYATQKPKELISRFVLASTNEGDVVADYYLGSGTTAEVCKDLNRNFIGCDINPRAVEIALKRLSND